MEKEDAILKNIDGTCLEILKNSKNVVVGLSGGSDSVALVHILLRLKKVKSYDFNIVAAHVNHLLRGEESFRDENFVRNFCEKFNIELKIFRVDVKDRAKKIKKGTEETARIVRYNFFRKIAQNLGDSLIAVAHTLTDSIETAVLNFVRGTGIDGLCGIKKHRGVVVRLILNLTKKDTINYCNVNKLDYVNDSSNNSLEYDRNKIRHKILPVFEEINKNFQKNFSRTFSLLEKDANFLESLARKKLNEYKIEENVYDALAFKSLPFSISSRCVRLVVGDFFSLHKKIEFSSLNFSLVNIILDFIKKGFGTVEIAKGVFVKVLDGLLRVYEQKNKKKKIKNIGFCVPIKKMLTDTKKQFTIKIVDFSHFNRDRLGTSGCRSALDYSAVPSDAVFRTRLPGDTFKPAFRNVTKSLKKFFNESKVARGIRNNVPLIASGSRVLWIEGFGVCDDCCVRKGKTEKVLIINRVDGKNDFWYNEQGT